MKMYSLFLNIIFTKEEIYINCVKIYNSLGSKEN